MAKKNSPKVSVGMPVYNGEEHISHALDSILGQTFGDFELIICDNASTDATWEICRDYEKRDRRILCLRNSVNLGAAPNYNRVFAASSGRYFKWAAHDDVLCPDFFEKCVAALDAAPDAALCRSRVEYIDEKGKSLGVYDSPLKGSDSSSPSRRFAALVLNEHPSNDFFGLIRRKFLEGSLLHGSYHGADRALLAELALCGRLIQIREPLLRMRERPDRYTRSMRLPRERAAWHDSKQSKRPGLPLLRCFADFLRAAFRRADDRVVSFKCLWHLARWWFVNWNFLRMATEMIGLVYPNVIPMAEDFKRKRFGPPQGPLALKKKKQKTTGSP